MLGLTEEQYWDMFRRQNGLCAICQKPESGIHKGKLMNLSVDHCHATGKVRELLCSLCNRGLGHFLDDPAILQSAIGYLERFK